MRYKEISHNPIKSKIKHFIHYAHDKLKLEGPVPEIKFSEDERDAVCHHHTGSYNFHKDKIWVYIKGRALVDILRTVCHELVHVKQDQQHLLRHHDKPGSKHETQADMIAGTLIKLYGAEHPDIFKSTEQTDEAVYPGNIGAMEVSQFFMKASPEQKAEVKRLIANQEFKSAWKIIQSVLNVKLHGKEFA